MDTFDTGAFGWYDQLCRRPCRPSRSIRAQARKQERSFGPDRTAGRGQDRQA